MTGIWCNDAFSFEGKHFTAIAQTARPRPVQQPVPLWFGGNSVLARRRAARAGHGWTPLMNDPTAARTTRTDPLDTVEKLGVAVEQPGDFGVAEGRETAEV